MQTPARTLYLPKPGPGGGLPNPYVCCAPTGAILEAWCTPKVDSGWRSVNSPQQKPLAGSAVELVLELAQLPVSLSGPPNPRDGFNIRILGPGGGPIGLIGGDYSDIAARSGIDPDSLPTGVTFTDHEIGPDIGFEANIPGAADAAQDLADRWLMAIRRHVARGDLQVILSPPGQEPAEVRPNLRFVLPAGGAGTLAGFLIGEPVLTITPVGLPPSDRRFSLTDIQSHPVERVEPGPHRVRIDLPWGGWSTLVHPPSTGEPVECRLPERVRPGTAAQSLASPWRER